MYSRHVDADHGLVVVEQVLRQRAHQFGLADAGGTQEDEAADGPVGIAQSGAVAQDGVGHQLHGLVLADHAVLQPLRHLHQLLDLAFHHAGDRNAGPLGHDAGDIVFVDLLLEQRVLLDGFELLLGGLNVLLDLRRAGRSGAARPFPNRRRGWPSPLPGAGVSCSSLSSRTRVMALFSRFQRSFSDGGFAAQPSPARSPRGAAVRATRCRFSLLSAWRSISRCEMRRSRSSISIGMEPICRRSADAGLVDQVDGLIRQEAVGDVAVRKHGGGDDGRVLDAHAVMDLELLLEAAQNGDGVVDGRLADHARSGSGAPGRRPFRRASCIR